MPLTRISGPAVEPVSLADARLQCRITADDTSEDTLLQLYIRAARETAEHELGRALIAQTWEERLDAFPSGGITLGRALASSITSVQYTSPAGGTVTLDPSAYRLIVGTSSAQLLPASGTSWPTAADDVDSVRVRFVCGYGETAAAVPDGVRQWLLLTVAAYYAQREAVDASGRVAELPARFVDRLLDAERIYA